MNAVTLYKLTWYDFEETFPCYCDEHFALITKDNPHIIGTEALTHGCEECEICFPDQDLLEELLDEMVRGSN